MCKPSPTLARFRLSEKRLLHLWFWSLWPMALLSAPGPSFSASSPTGEPIIMEVASAQVCLFVERLKPVESGRRFPARVGRLYCLSRISNIEKETEIHHVWHRGTEKRLDLTLAVKPPSWRTYSWKRIQPNDVGEWRVDICDAAGNVLKTIVFEVYDQP